jgi:ABC-type transport system substrate-binding protein
MGGNPYTFHQIRLKESQGGPFGCIPTEYITVLSDGMDFTNTLKSRRQSTHTIMDLIYSRLWVVDPLDPHTQSAPDLAYNWWTNATTASGDIHDGMKYTFQLYDNITWHDGTPFTSEDVHYSLMTIHPWGTYTADEVEDIYRIDTPDDYTVEIYSNDSSYLGFNKATSLQILPKHIWEPYEAGNFTWSPGTPVDLSGTGCFQWVTRVPGQYVILDRYPDWHFAVEHPDRPNCPGPLIIDPIPPYSFLFIIIAIQVIILVLLLRRRQERMKTVSKKEYTISRS